MFASLLAAGIALASNLPLPPQVLAPAVGGQDCAVMTAVLSEYLIRARQTWGSGVVPEVEFFVLADSDTRHVRQISPTSMMFQPEAREALQGLLAQPAGASLDTRAHSETSLLTCDLPDGFAYAHTAEDVQLDTPHEAFVYQMFPAFWGLLSVSLPGYSPDECESVVSVFGDFPIWEEHFVYYLVKHESGWEVESTFEVHLRGE